MAPKQRIAQGFITLFDGGQLPRSTYESEMERLRVEAMALNPALDPQWVERKISRDIVNLYGLVCWQCKDPITLHYSGAPLQRRLKDEHLDGPLESDKIANFCADCWQTYKRAKQNKRRRHQYAANHGVGNPQLAPAVLPGDGEQQPAALPANHPPPAPAVIQGVGNPQPEAHPADIPPPALAAGPGVDNLLPASEGDLWLAFET